MPRKVTWLELFFDLVFVAAVSQVAAPLSRDYSPAGLWRFAVLFVLVWWAWFGHTVFATRFDTDDLRQRALTLLQMFVVAVMGINAGEALDSRESAGFAAAYAVLRLVLVVQYVRARRLEHSRPLSTQYLVGCGVAALLWLVSALTPAPTRFWLWALAFLVDVVTPLVAERHSPKIPPDASHLPERFGLFTIILLGESVLAVMGGMRGQETWSADAAVSAFGALTLLFLLWWWYFDDAAGAAEREVRCHAESVRLRVWSYAHLPLYVGVALSGVGLEHVISVAGEDPLPAPEAVILSGSVALVMLALIVIGATGERGGAPIVGRREAGGAALAAGTACLGIAGPLARPMVFVLLLVACVLSQVALGFLPTKAPAPRQSDPDAGVAAAPWSPSV